MLESITLSNVATYDSDGAEITDLKKINFIYGTNGSGKTTISKLIHDPSGEQYEDCELGWKNGAPVKALVYNKDFRDRNFGKGKIEGVFTIGQATKEEIEAIEKLQKELSEIKAEGIKKKEAIEDLEAAREEADEKLKNALWDEVYKKHNGDFKEAFTGFARKEAFKTKLMEEYEENKLPVTTPGELKGKAATLFGAAPMALPLIGDIAFARLLEIEADAIWNKKIIGKTDVSIAALILQLNLNDWVNEGRQHLHGGNKTCPFCQQETITEDFKKQLENYFDEAFTRDTKKVKLLAEEYLGISQNILQFLQHIESAEKSNAESQLNLALFTAYHKIVSGQLATNRELLGNKMKEPSRSIQVVSSKEAAANVQKIIADSNEKIKAHNDIVNDYANQKALLVKAIWKYLAESAKPKVEDFKKKIEKLDRDGAALEEQRQELLKKYQALDKKIKGANRSVTGVQTAVDEINRLLTLHGFLNFEIVPTPNNPHQYQIQRQNGTIAEATLSEGEVTFITFLYFLQLAKGSTREESITDERILVVDDPVSNLDNNSLFVVSSLIKEVIKDLNEDRGNIRQLILLTHNIYFHKEVSFIDSKMKAGGDYNFYIIRRNGNVSFVEDFGIENPVLNSYELLWRELSHAENNSVLTTQNLMRQILTHYFKLIGKTAGESLLQNFEDAQEQEICRFLVRPINDTSNGFPYDLYVEQQETIAEKYFEVFRKIFKETGHSAHYEMMFSGQKEMAE